MEHQSEFAVDLASLLATECWYPRMADLITKAVELCAQNATPLTEEQQNQLYRASFEAGDGIHLDIAHVVDHDSARRLIQSASFPFDPEVSP